MSKPSGIKKTLTIKSDLKEITPVVNEIAAYLKSRGVDDNVLHDLKLVIDEALINAMKHGNKFQAGLPVVIDFNCSPNKISIAVQDTGDGYEYNKLPDPTSGENITKGHGRGVFLIRKLMDEVHFNKSGNRIEMIKYAKLREERMQEKRKVVGDVTVCFLNGEININTSPELRKVFDELAEKKAAKVVLDLGGVPYIDSSGLATLIEMLRRMKRYDGKLRLCNLSEKIRSLFEITKLTKLFEMFDKEEDALKGF